MNTTFTSLQNFSAEYTTRLLNAGANSLSLLNQILSQAPQTEKWAECSARSEKQQLRANLRLSLMQNIEEKQARQFAFKMPIDAHKHKRKPPALHVAKASSTVLYTPSTTM